MWSIILREMKVKRWRQMANNNREEGASAVTGAKVLSGQ
jgi:hypothetical protein